MPPDVAAPVKYVSGCGYFQPADDRGREDMGDIARAPLIIMRRDGMTPDNAAGQAALSDKHIYIFYVALLELECQSG